MGYDLSLNCDRMSSIGPNRNQARVDTRQDVSHTPNLNLSYDKKGIRERRAQFPGLTEREKRRENEESQRLPSKIYRVLLVGFRRAKNKSS